MDSIVDVGNARFDASIIIPVFNGLKDTERCIEALAANTTGVSYEVIVVDNASKDGTPEFILALGGDVRIITNPSNLGFAKACNQGARAASGRYLVFLNNDTIPQTGWLSALVTLADAEPSAAIIGSKLIYPGSNRIQHAGIVFGPLKEPYHIYQNIDAGHPAVNSVEEFQAVTAACMLIRSEVFFEAGMFDEQYVNGYEDIDLCLKVRALGHRILYAPLSVLYHAEFSTEGRKDRQAENLALFLGKWKTRIVPDEELYYAKHGHKIIYDPKDPRKYSIIEDKSAGPVCEAVRAKNGSWSMRLTAEDGSARSAHSMYEPEAEARTMADALQFNGEGLLVLLGAGMGHHIHALMARFPAAEIIVIEPLREIYETASACGALPEGPRYIVGAKTADALREVASMQAGRGVKPLGLFALNTEAGAFPSLFNPLLEVLQRTVSVRLWEKLRYAKFRDARLRVIVFDSEYFLVREVVAALTRLGHEVRRIAVGKDVRPDAMIESLIGKIVEFRPDFVLTVNHLGFDEEGVLTEFLRSIELPAASWFVDSPRIIVGDHKGNVSPYMVMCTWEKTYMARIRAMGFQYVYYLPLGTDETVFKPMQPSAKQIKRYGAPVGFVGDSMVKPSTKKLNELPERMGFLQT